MNLQGEIYWAELPAPRGSEPGFRRPVVVVQNDAINRSAIRTILVCPLSTNLRLAEAPGNVLLRAGEAGLTMASVVNVSQTTALDRSYLDELVGRLAPRRVREIPAGITMLVTPQP
jgi:mRNA interferase MazF